MNASSPCACCRARWSGWRPASTGPRGRCGSATAATCCSATSRTTASCAGTTLGRAQRFRQPSNYANGHTRDRQGRLLACEHVTRRDHAHRVRRPHHRAGRPLRGQAPELAQRHRLRQRRQHLVHRPALRHPRLVGGRAGHARTAARRLPHRPGHRRTGDGARRSAGQQRPGLLRPTRRCLYVVESRATPHRRIWRTTSTARSCRNKRLFVDADGPGCLRRHRASTSHGNVWCGFGSTGAPGADAARTRRRARLRPPTAPLAHIHLPERCANLCFGGAKNNRLFMASSHSLYALHVNTRGAV